MSIYSNVLFMSIIHAVLRIYVTIIYDMYANDESALGTNFIIITINYEK